MNDIPVRCRKNSKFQMVSVLARRKRVRLTGQSKMFRSIAQRRSRWLFNALRRPVDDPSRIIYFPTRSKEITEQLEEFRPPRPSVDESITG